ncbi:hypothetical protein GCM10007108_05740 [Thermogymnomonas acidicola]|uniref:Uncharacterized protein n=1 Tax=Thermogymnomonas acidicola TaxID=399579 RepID=A0AA37BQI4_9ARCH|nr:hypothetical protein [Thermogymnomonas acidicola]GGM70577.1 hypothetical protein GCM10007108_05740 [Thermogymnomonas acidicola]
MEYISIVAIALSVVSICLWAYSLASMRGRKVEVDNTPRAVDAGFEVSGGTGKGESDEGPTASAPHHETYALGISTEELERFSLQVIKNLDMINKRIGVKFDVKPLQAKKESQGKK